jgi:Spy/CpxP family protein refolding chaperone
MRKRNSGIVVAIAALMLVGTFATAQPGPGGPGNGPAGGPPPDGALVQFLALSEAQLASWKTFHEELKAAIDPLIEQQRAAQQQLQAALDATTPDPAAIGNAMLAIRAIGNQIRAAHDALDAKLKSVLSPEQVLKFDAFRAAQQAMQGPRPGGPGNGPGAGQGNGRGTCHHCGS